MQYLNLKHKFNTKDYASYFSPQGQLHELAEPAAQSQNNLSLHYQEMWLVTA